MTIDINRSKMHDYCIITDCLDKKYGSDGWDMRVLTQKPTRNAGTPAPSHLIRKRTRTMHVTYI